MWQQSFPLHIAQHCVCSYLPYMHMCVHLMCVCSYMLSTHQQAQTNHSSLLNCKAIRSLHAPLLCAHTHTHTPHILTHSIYRTSQPGSMHSPSPEAGPPLLHQLLDDEKNENKFLPNYLTNKQSLHQFIYRPDVMNPFHCIAASAGIHSNYLPSACDELLGGGNRPTPRVN